jgi:hypothetical protein
MQRSKKRSLSTRFSGPSAFGEIEGEADTHRNHSRTVASGGNIFLIWAKNRADEISKVVNLVSQLLNAKLDDQQIGATKFDFADIGIIYPAHRDREVLVTESLIPDSRLNAMQQSFG